MKTMNHIANGFLIFTIFTLLTPGCLWAQENNESRWISLFNGNDLTGWIVPEKDHTWKVIDGVIDYEAKGGNLVTKREFEDYVLRFEWRFKRTDGPHYNAKIFNSDGTQKKDANNKPITKAIPNADSGIFTRGNAQTQVNLWCWPCGSGQLWSYHTSEDPEIRKGALPRMKADRPVGQWNEMEITMRGEAIKVVLNGKIVIDTIMPGAPTKGPITLQHHGGYNEKKKQWSSASALVQFRNIYIKELPKKDTHSQTDWVDLFNGKNLDGWKFQFENNSTENKNTFTVKDGVIYCTGKPSGFMYTDKAYSNYTLQVDLAFERPDGLQKDENFRGNSGVLIHIGDKNALRFWPKCIEVQGKHVNTGQILPIPRNLKCKHTDDKESRVEVLKPVGQWNTLEIDVDGGDMVIYLNDTVVSTISDCELTEGAIGLQSENAPTQWRNIRIREY